METKKTKLQQVGEFVTDHMDVICLAAVGVGGGMLGFKLGWKKGVRDLGKLLPDYIDEIGYASFIITADEINKFEIPIDVDKLAAAVSKKFHKIPEVKSVIENCNKLIKH